MEVAAPFPKLPIRLIVHERDDKVIAHKRDDHGLRDKRATQVWTCPLIALGSTENMGEQDFLTATKRSSLDSPRGVGISKVTWILASIYEESDRASNPSGELQHVQESTQRPGLQALQ
jgi:hypothetical protein